MAVIWNSVSPISRPTGARMGKSTVKPMPTTTREMSKIRFALASENSVIR